MIVHMVLMKFDDPAHAEESERIARELAGKIDVVRRLEVGRTVYHTENAYDLGLLVELDSVDDLVTYKNHPAHEEAAAYWRPLRTAIASCDFEA